jgi:MHS family proline/betaine transporter-like MFS transporter
VVREHWAALLCFSGTGPATLPALFPTKIRAGALSVAFNISVSLFGATTPLVTAALVTATHNLLAPGCYPMGGTHRLRRRAVHS